MIREKEVEIYRFLRVLRAKNGLAGVRADALPKDSPGATDLVAF